MNELAAIRHNSKALDVFEHRAKLISRNISNADTPGFKAKDIDFAEALSHADANLGLKKTQQEHIPLQPEGGAERLYYRVPMQRKADENTVDGEIERKNFMENSMRYQAAVGFIQSSASQLIKAFRGE